MKEQREKRERKTKKRSYSIATNNLVGDHLFMQARNQKFFRGREVS